MKVLCRFSLEFGYFDLSGVLYWFTFGFVCCLDLWVFVGCGYFTFELSVGLLLD